MLTIRETRASVRRTAALHSLRVQVVLLLVLAVLLPGLLWTPWTIAIPTIEAVRQAMVGAAIAVVVGLFLFRRVTAYPGVRAFAFILPSYAVAYGLVMLGFFGSRLDYSSIYLIESFSIALVVSFALNAWLEHRAILRFYVVPTGDIDFISTIPDVEWVVMSRPDVALPPGVPLVADLRYDHAPEWERVLAEAAVGGHPVYHSKQLRESLTGRVSMEHLSENSFGSLLPNLAYRKMKRLLDLVLCMVGMPLILGITAVVAILIRLDSRGPVFFIQDRMGYRGKVFRIIKFRTMHPRQVVTDATAALQDAMTQSDDARITKFGRFLRRTRLDELPQVFNVIKGEMSLIGPRPEAVSLSHWYEAEIPFYFYRHIVRPGISGWAQVHQGHVTDLESVHEKLTYDFYYIKNFSAWLDMLIVLRTVLVVVSGFGSK